MSSNSRRKFRPSGQAVFVGVFLSAAFTLWNITPEGYFDTSSDRINSNKIENQQESGEVVYYKDGRSYGLWEGLVMEQLNNKESDNLERTAVDNITYNFDIGSLTHRGRADGDIENTPFNAYRDLAGKLPKHFDRVRHYGCTVAQRYEDRQVSGKYGKVPDDVKVYFERHCSDYTPVMAP